MKKELFEYPTPKQYLLKEEYPTPYRFSKELRDHVNMLFSHPHNQYHKLFYNKHREYDSNDMLKPAWRILQDFRANPQYYKHKLENIHENILKDMWSTFLSLHKFRGNQFKSYKPMKLRWLDIGGGNLLDLLLKEEPMMSGDDMVKKRDGLELRESHRAGMKEGSKAFEYLCQLD